MFTLEQMTVTYHKFIHGKPLPIEQNIILSPYSRPENEMIFIYGNKPLLPLWIQATSNYFFPFKTNTDHLTVTQ